MKTTKRKSTLRLILYGLSLMRDRYSLYLVSLPAFDVPYLSYSEFVLYLLRNNRYTRIQKIILEFYSRREE